MKYIIIIGVGLSAVMLFLLAIAGDDSDFFRMRRPNALVYRVMLETAFSRGEYGPVDENDIPDSTGDFNRMGI